MRQKFVPCEELEQAQQECPWASVCEHVVGGYMCFESWVDYDIWNLQL